MNTTVAPSDERGKLALDLDTAQSLAQLEMLGYTQGDTVYFRLLAGTGLSGRAKNLVKTFPQLPSQPKDKGLFVIVNGGGHKDENVLMGRAFFCEWDDRPIEEQVRLWEKLGFLEPTFQIQTRKSIHSYWVLNRSCPIDLWRPVQAKILDHLDGDRSLKNPSRPMRLAGSWHYKAGEDPIQCPIINAPGKIYSLSEIENAIPSNPHWSDGICFVDPEPKKPKPKLIEPTAIGIDPIPLEIALAPSSRDLIAGGCSETRNANGAKLARDLIGTESHLISNNILYSGDAYQLFLEFCHRCPGDDWSQKEWENIWRKAQKDNPQPTLSSDKIENCINAYLKRQGKNSLLQVYNQDIASNGKKPQDTNETIKLGDNRKALDFIRGIWGDKLAFNLRTLEIELEGKKLDIDQVPMVLADSYNVSITKDRANDACYYLAKQKEYDPFVTYLESTKHKSEQGINKHTLAPLLLFSNDPYHAEVLWLFLLALVKRAYEPGCKWDNALILQGEQGIGKSSFFRALVGNVFFKDTMTKNLDKDDLRILHAHPLIEWGELGNFTARQFADTIKQFLSRQEDQFRLPYAKDIIRYPRRSVIAGSVNEKQFLTDLTGNRRFMVLPCQKIIPPDILVSMRDNIFAAVLQDYFANWQGENHPLVLPQEVQERQKAENENYLHSDVLQDAIGEILEDQEGLEFSMAEIMQRLQAWRNELLRLNPGDRSTQMRIAKILNQYGWVKKQKKVNGKNMMIWLKP